MISNPYLDGQVLVVDKPLEWTSFDVVNKIRYAIRDKYQIKKKIKVGHAGTLDPLATGVVVICTGKKTKTINDFLIEDKEYTGKIQLGSTTPSFDLETAVDATYPIPKLNSEILNDLTNIFSGEINQVPPVYSAKRINGKRAYDYARSNEKIILPPNKIEIKELKLNIETEKILSFYCKCSKGTYVRSLARDIGLALKSGAFLVELRRIKSGNFTIDEAKSVYEWIDIIKSS
jgi:tRNA pseudouridine55 synthase